MKNRNKTYQKPAIRKQVIAQNVWMKRTPVDSESMLSDQLMSCWIGTCSAFGGSGPCSWSC